MGSLAFPFFGREFEPQRHREGREGAVEPRTGAGVNSRRGVGSLCETGERGRPRTERYAKRGRFCRQQNVCGEAARSRPTHFPSPPSSVSQRLSTPRREFTPAPVRGSTAHRPRCGGRRQRHGSDHQPTLIPLLSFSLSFSLSLRLRVFA
jgi:hypothetical protein